MKPLARDTQQCKWQSQGYRGSGGHLLGGTCEQASSTLEVTFISHSSRPWAPSSWRTPAVCLSVSPQ